MAPSLDRAQRIWRYRIFAITWLAYAGFYLCRRNFSVVMPLLEKDLGYTNFQLANIIFGYSICYSLGQFCFGSLADRFGSRVTVTFGLLLSITATVLMGILPTIAALAVLSCLNGLGQSAGWPGLVKNMAAWFRHQERGVVMGWWTTNYVIGGFLAVVFATYVSTHYGWRAGFWMPAVLLFLVTMAFAAIARNRPSDAGVAEIDSPTEEDTSVSGPQPAAKGFIFLKMLGDPEVWVIALGCAFSKIIRYSFLYWLPIYMTQKLRYSTSEAGYTSSLFELVGFVGAIVAGYFSDKFMHSRRLGVAAIMFWGLAFMCWIHPTLAAMGHIGTGLGIALIGIMNFGPDTLLQGAASQDAGAKWGVGRASGFISGFGSIGQVFSPFLVAYVADKYGWDRLFYGFVEVAFVGGALLASQAGRETRQLRVRMAE